MSPPRPPAAGALLDASAQALYCLDKEGRVVVWNWGAETMYGWTAASAVGRTMFELQLAPGLDDEIRATLQEAIDSGSAIVEGPRRSLDGQELEVQSVWRRIDDGHGSIFVAVADSDITPQRRLEQELSGRIWALTKAEGFLHGILQATTEYSIIAISLDGRIEAWNVGAKLQHGYDEATAIGRPAQEILVSAGEVESRRFDNWIDAARLRGKFEAEFQARRSDGSTFPARMTLQLRRDHLDQPVGFVIVSKDVTEEKKAEEQRQVAQVQLAEIKHLQEMNQLKTQLLNTASHELNTPLTPVKLNLHLLREGKMGDLNPRQASALAIVHRNIERLSALVQDVLDVARIQSGRLQVERTQVDLVPLLQEAYDSFHEAASQTGIDLRIEAPRSLKVVCDGRRLVQVLYNLLSNALKFTPTGGFIVLAASSDGTKARLSVTDSGVGLTAEQCGRLFQPFSQVHDPMQKTRAGSGLGLYISRGIVEEHGGTMGVQSEGPNQGATFWLEIPLGPPAGRASA